MSTSSSQQNSQPAKTARILDVIVVGGGLSGLYVGYGLLGHNGNTTGQQLPWKSLEASDRLGGRIVNAAPSVLIDMGGAWIWPDRQPHVRELASRFSLTTFPQPDDPSSTRIDGGAVQLIKRLAEQVMDGEARSGEDGKNIVCRAQMNSPVKSCKLLLKGHDISTDRDALVEVETVDGTRYVARRVVFAVPPKVLSSSVLFDPPLLEAKRAAMAASRTWMAGVTKVALVYPRRFWDRQSSSMGLPAAATAAAGPAFQVYDSGTKDGGVAALTFFSHIPPDDALAQTDDALVAKQVAGQMGALWGYLGKPAYAKLAFTYTSYYVYRWPTNPFISGDDTKPAQVHPHPMPSRALSTPEWNGKLLFAGTETDLGSPGVMEGAIGAAIRVLKSLLQ